MQAISYTVGHPQADGRCYVSFEFTLDDDSVVLTGDRGPFAVTTAEALDPIRDAIGTDIEELAAYEEYRRHVQQVAALVLVFNTNNQFASRLEKDWRSRGKVERCELSHWLIEMLAAGHVTDAQCRNAFGKTAQQWTNLKNAKIIPEHDAWETVLVAEGE